MKGRLPDTGPPRENAGVMTAPHRHNQKGDDVNPNPASENALPRLGRQVHRYSNEKTLPGQEWSKLFAAAARRPSSELTRLLDIIEPRIDFYRGKILNLVAVRGAIQSELSRRAALHGLTSIGGEMR